MKTDRQNLIDSGAQFVSDEMEKYFQDNGIEHRTSTPLWPQANGEVERQNRSLLKSWELHKQRRRTDAGNCWNFLQLTGLPHTPPLEKVQPSCYMVERSVQSYRVWEKVLQEWLQTRTCAIEIKLRNRKGRTLRMAGEMPKRVVCCQGTEFC